jgi:hypothetical protein
VLRQGQIFSGRVVRRQASILGPYELKVIISVVLHVHLVRGLVDDTELLCKFCPSLLGTKDYVGIATKYYYILSSLL